MCLSYSVREEKEKEEEKEENKWLLWFCLRSECIPSE
jgi:hypothetical protein